MERWKVFDSEKIIDNKWIVVEKQKCEAGNNIIEDYYVVRKRDYVVLVVEDDECLLFLKQYRHGIGETILNLPMGFIEKGETPEITARRELIEETGYHADKFIFVGEFFTAPSSINFKAHVFYVKTSKENADFKNPDIGENDAVLLKIPKKEIKEMLDKNQIKDMSSVVALMMADKKFNLFSF